MHPARAMTAGLRSPGLRALGVPLLMVAALLGACHDGGSAAPAGPMPAAISAPPQSATINELQSATLSVQASGTPPLAYQWQQSTDGTSWTTIAGAASASYTTPALSRLESGTQYRAVVDNAAHAAATSAAATVTVTPDPSVLLAAGGTLTGDGGKFQLIVPAGVLAGATRFTFTTLSSISGVPAGYTLRAGTAYQIDWTGAGFTANRTVTVGVQATATAAGSAAAPALHATPVRHTLPAPTTPNSSVVHCTSSTVVLDTTNPGTGYQQGVIALCPDNPGTSPVTGTTQFGLVTPPAGGWTQVSTGLAYALGSAAFADANTAVALGSNAGYLRSTDGGQTWASTTSPVGYYDSGRVAFLDASVGVIVTDNGHVLRSTDAGATWLPITTLPASLGPVAFGSSSVGVALGSLHGEVYRTTDAGLSWTPASAPGTGFFSYTGAAFADANTVVAVANNVIRRSADGGDTWMTVLSGVRNTLTTVAFGSPQNGVAVGTYSNLLYTTDGGLTWQPATTPPAGLTTAGYWGVTFLNATTVIATGGATGVGTFPGVIIKSIDGGATWTQIDAGIGAGTSFDGVAFANAQLGVVIGGSGTIVRTATGGQ